MATGEYTPIIRYYVRVLCVIFCNDSSSYERIPLFYESVYNNEIFTVNFNTKNFN